MSVFKRVKLNSAQITHDIIDGEVVIINLANGNYYGTDGTGSEIWTLISKNFPMKEIESELLCRYAASASEIRESLGVFVNDLIKEGLVTAGDENVNKKDSEAKDSFESLEGKNPFQPPILNIYSDMQDFLLLDPIHEVDDSGWPNKKEDSAAD